MILLNAWNLEFCHSLIEFYSYFIKSTCILGCVLLRLGSGLVLHVSWTMVFYFEKHKNVFKKNYNLIDQSAKDKVIVVVLSSPNPSCL